MRILRYILPLLILAASCARDPLPQGCLTPVPDGYRTVHHKVTATGAVTARASLDGSSHYVFEAGDRLYVMKTVAQDTVLYGFLILVSGANQATAHFEGNLACAEDFDLGSSTTVDVTLVSSGDLVHTVKNGKLVSTAIPADACAEDMESAVRLYSNFSASTTFGSNSITLSQHTTFVQFRLRTSSDDLPASTDVDVCLYNGGEPEPVLESTVTAMTAGKVIFVAAFDGGVALSGAELSLDWTDALSAPHSKTYNDIADHTLAANHVYSVARSDVVYSGFRIRAKYDDTTITFKYNVEFSLDDGETWDSYTANTNIYLDADEQVCFRGSLANCNRKGSTPIFMADKLCYVAGNITSLLANPNTLATNAFRSAFSYGNVNENSPSALSNPTLVHWVDIDPLDPLILPDVTSANCYMEMFVGCDSLTTAPSLPATVLADKCYFRMFHSCFSLRSIPSHPSEVTWSGTNRYCYQMFQSCTGITTLTGQLFVDENSSVATGCFEDMFAHCTQLDSVSTGFLPATTLAANCYRGMFQDTRFATAPDLPATTLSSECYRYMFNGCSNLTYIKCLATTNIGNGYTTNWVGGSTVPNTSGCTFVRSGTTTWPRTVHGVLSNWEIVNFP